MSRSFLLFLSIVVCTGTALADSNSAVAFWRQAIAQKPLTDLATAIHDKSLPAWPRIDSSRRYHLQGAPFTSDERLALAQALHEKIQQYFRANSGVSLKNVRIYSDIAATLQEAGGYSNLLLADSLNRLAIFELSACLVKKQAPPEEAKPLVTGLRVSETNVRTFLERFTADDELLNSDSSRLANIDTSHDAVSAIQSLGIPSGKIAYELMLPANQSVTRLLREPSAIELLLRRSTTELLTNVNLPALITFIEHGGKYDELNPADIRAFRQRMQGAAQPFPTTLSKVKSVTVSDVLSLYNLHNDPQRREVFLKIALD